MKISSDLKTWKYARLFLDTNALVNLLLLPDFKENGAENLDNYLKETGIRIHTCDYCIGEVMGVLKRKWQHKNEKPHLTTDGYLMIINRLNWNIDHNTYVLAKLSLSNKDNELHKIVKKYRIDYIDALLLNYTLKSKDHDLFVTGDRRLAKAANELGALCWNIIDSAVPPE